MSKAGARLQNASEQAMVLTTAIKPMVSKQAAIKPETSKYRIQGVDKQEW